MDIKENLGILLSCEHRNEFWVADWRNLQMCKVKGLGQACKWEILLVRGTQVTCETSQAIAEMLETIQGR